MILRTPSTTRTDPLFPDTTIFRSRTAPTSGSGTGSSARAAGQTRFSRPLRSRRGLRAPDLVAAGDMAVLVAHRGRAVGGEEDRAVEVDHVEIGRASCRERGCPDGSLSVVAVTLKKKTQNKTD